LNCPALMDVANLHQEHISYRVLHRDRLKRYLHVQYSLHGLWLQQIRELTVGRLLMVIM